MFSWGGGGVVREKAYGVLAKEEVVYEHLITVLICYAFLWCEEYGHF